MYRLDQLLSQLDYTCLQGETDIGISQIAYDSRQVLPGALFVCIKGADEDGHRYIGDAIRRGAAALLVQEEVQAPKQVVVVHTKDTRLGLAAAAAEWFHHPAKQLKIIGVTGTKGKTTTSCLIYEMLKAAGYSAGLIGTIQIAFGETSFPAKHTTPESYELQQVLRQMADADVRYVVMEVSSQGLKLYRTAGILFDVGVFTNLQPDHIGPGEHASFEEYMQCKARLFRQCRMGILNRDDAHWQDMLKGSSCQVRTFGLSCLADYYARDAVLTRGAGFLGIRCRVSGCVDFEAQVATPGTFSLYNSLAAISVCHQYGVPETVMQQVLYRVRVRGRIELVEVPGRFTVLIDYAHNAMALENLLTTLLEYRPGRLICLFGCGGNRAKSRRYEMGEVSGQLADLTILTSDNPRFEDPLDIINDIKTGILKTRGAYVEIPDRKEAIRYGLTHAKPGDILVIAGKGHETYQEIRGVKYPMDDRSMIEEISREETNRKDSR